MYSTTTIDPCASSKWIAIQSVARRVYCCCKLHPTRPLARPAPSRAVNKRERRACDVPSACGPIEAILARAAIRAAATNARATTFAAPVLAVGFAARARQVAVGHRGGPCRGSGGGSSSGGSGGGGDASRSNDGGGRLLPAAICRLVPRKHLVADDTQGARLLHPWQKALRAGIAAKSLLPLACLTAVSATMEELLRFGRLGLQTKSQLLVQPEIPRFEAYHNSARNYKLGILDTMNMGHILVTLPVRIPE